mmetsp:Transcript_113335/g.321121  ORF Transcript_113335/g.321121 Transcript_113335/m.321121 type:complete len:111 (-) Transcript_113335:93-425(-)
MVATHSFAKFPNSHLAVPPRVKEPKQDGTRLFGSNLSCGACPALTFPNNHLATAEMAGERRERAARVLAADIACGAYPTVTFPNDHLVTRKSRAGFAHWASSTHGDSDSE